MESSRTQQIAQERVLQRLAASGVSVAALPSSAPRRASGGLPGSGSTLRTAVQVPARALAPRVLLSERDNASGGARGAVHGLRREAQSYASGSAPATPAALNTPVSFAQRAADVAGATVAPPSAFGGGGPAPLTPADVTAAASRAAFVRQVEVANVACRERDAALADAEAARRRAALVESAAAEAASALEERAARSEAERATLESELEAAVRARDALAERQAAAEEAVRLLETRDAEVQALRAQLQGACAQRA